MPYTPEIVSVRLTVEPDDEAGKGNVGVYAVATIRFKTEQGGWTGLNEIRTPGLWEIDGPDESYLREVGAEELHELADQLRALGMTPWIVSPADVEIRYKG